MELRLAGLGERVKARRKYLDMTQDEVGDIVGCGGPTIHNWEHGKRGIQAEDLIRLAAALSTTVAYLAGEDEQEKWLDDEMAANYERVPPQLKPIARDIIRRLAEDNRAEG